MVVKGLDTLLAIKVINLIPDLRPSDRRVGVALIEHFNRRTGRCDPGLERIAALLGISIRTAIRSTERLHAMKLFHKIRHGGWSNRNSYEPNWIRFAELDAAWGQRFKAQSNRSQSKMSPSTGQSSQLDGDSSVTQTCRDNLIKQTCTVGHPKEENRKRFVRQNLEPIAMVTKPGDAALAAAERRWTSALHQCFVSLPITYGDVIAAINPEMQAEANEAEMRCRGGGLSLILARLKIPNDR
jgi:hypothetical protein